MRIRSLLLFLAALAMFVSYYPRPTLAQSNTTTAQCWVIVRGGNPLGVPVGTRYSTQPTSISPQYYVPVTGSCPSASPAPGTTPAPSPTPTCTVFTAASSISLGSIFESLMQLLGFFNQSVVAPCVPPPSPSPSPTPSPTPTASPIPTASPVPTISPTPSPTPVAAATVFSDTFEGDAPGSFPAALAQTSGAQWMITATDETNTLTHQITDTTSTLNDLFWYAPFGTQSVEEEASFLPATATTAGISMIVYSSDGQFITFNVVNGNLDYYPMIGGAVQSIGNSAGHVSTMSTSNYYCAKVFFTISSTLYSIATKVWQCNQTEPGYSAAVTTGAYTFPSFTAGIRNNSGLLASVDDYGVALNGGTLPAIYGGSTALPTPAPTASPTATPAPTASPTATPAPTASPSPTATPTASPTPMTVQAAIQAASPAAFYRLNESPSPCTTALDTEGLSNGTYSGTTVTCGATSTVPGEARSVQFSGSSSPEVNTNIPVGNAALTSGSFSVVGFTTFTNVGNTARLIGNAHADSVSNVTGFQLYPNSNNGNGDWEFDVRDGANGLLEAAIYTQGNVLPSTQYCVVGTFSPTVGARVYVNGVLGATAPSDSGSLVMTNASANTVLIGSTPGVSQNYQGTIGDVAIFPTALTQTQVNSICGVAATPAPSPSPTGTPTASPAPTASPSPTPTPTPTPVPTVSPTPPASLVYQNATPFPAGSTPIAVTIPSETTLTFEAGINCVPNTTGAAVFQAVSAWSVTSGLCNASTGATNPGDATGAHIYDVAGASQAVPSTGLSPGWTFIAGTADGTNLKYYICTGSPATCAVTTLADTAALANNTGAFIGGANATTRVNGGDIAYIKIFSAARSASQIQSDATTVINAGDPYPSPSPSPTATAVAQATTGPCIQDPASAPTSFNTSSNVWCQPMPSASPNIASNSTAIISFYAQNHFAQNYDQGCCSGMYEQFGATNVNAPQYAVRDALHYATTSDPKYTIVYNGTCHSATAVPNFCEQAITDTVIYLPEGALPQGGTQSCNPNTVSTGEFHMAVVQPNGDYVEFSGVCGITDGTNGNPGTITVNTADMLTAAQIATNTGFACGNGASNPQFSNCTGGSITNSARLITMGVIGAQELLNGSINHAIAFDGSCTNGQKVAPGIGSGSDSICEDATAQKNQQLTNSLYAAQRLFMNVCPAYPAYTCTQAQQIATINSWTLPTINKEILIALVKYGMYLTDELGSQSNGTYFEAVDPHSFTGSHAMTNMWPTVASTYSLGAYPNGGTANFGYDPQFRNVPTNPNAPAGATGYWSWMEVCASTGC